MSALPFSRLLAAVCSISGLVLTAAAPEAPPPLSQAPQINARGTFADRAGWTYKDAHGGIVFSVPYDGTNELLSLPAPSPPPGGTVVGVEILRQRGDHMGYPIHISLLAKAFARIKGLQEVYVMDAPGALYRYDVTDPIWNQHTVQGDDDNKKIVNAAGPISATASMPLVYQTAFTFAKNSLESIANLPTVQKTMGNYDVAFVETEDAVWVEFGPHYASTEPAHLGCQTQLGRDMVFGFLKADLGQGKNRARFLQCF
jgi:hypothetical protein